MDPNVPVPQGTTQHAVAVQALSQPGRSGGKGNIYEERLC